MTVHTVTNVVVDNLDSPGFEYATATAPLSGVLAIGSYPPGADAVMVGVSTGLIIRACVGEVAPATDVYVPIFDQAGYLILVVPKNTGSKWSVFVQTISGTGAVHVKPVRYGVIG